MSTTRRRRGLCSYLRNFNEGTHLSWWIVLLIPLFVVANPAGWALGYVAYLVALLLSGFLSRLLGWSLPALQAVLFPVIWGYSVAVVSILFGAIIAVERAESGL